MKKVLAIVLSALMVLSLVACNQENNQGGSGNSGGEKGTIALVIHRQDDDWSQSFAQGFEKAVKESGYDYEFLNPNGNLETQISNIESFTAKGVKAMSIIPLDVDAIVPAVKNARDKDIKIISEGPSTDHVMTSDGYGGGQQAAKALVEGMGEKGKIAIIDITATMPGVALRTKGFKEYLEKYPNIEIVEENRVMTTDEAISTAENIYTSHPDLNGVYGSFANATIGAGRAAKNMGLKDLTVVGIDGDKEILRMIDEGWIYATSSQNPIEQSAASVKNLIDQIEGKAEEKSEVVVDHVLVDKNNFKEIWKQIYGEDYK
ncbi:sugar ABC transporter substrate-binding protein [Helcococcus sueciensis]|uniref:sugar ABC transporter substrate-binding protein n=1 Tax=Helcococcus sueciensis TaxID=241555 RepID=UPI00041E5429|nr:sugar ABC transporter substrate-binding protein [Helcococcus sueciensis]